MGDSSIIPASAASRIAVYSYHPRDRSASPAELDIEQALHRIRIINTWSAIPKGSRLLEIGCGQGTCTTVLAEAVGPSGTIDAIDPAPLDYGAPVTLGQAHEWINQSEIGRRITWHQNTPEDYLNLTAAEGITWDAAVLTHCVWYFKSPDALKSILTALNGRVKKLCIAEYALKATQPAAVPHVLAALSRSALESQRKNSDENIQNIVGPDAIKAIAEEAGWILEKEGFLVPKPGLLDGFWETGTVQSKKFLEQIELDVQDPKLNGYLKATRESVIATAALHGGLKSVLTMDVWMASLLPAT